MKVDWKYFAQTTGYKSLKASVNRDKMQHPSSKDRYEKFFRDIINMVCKYSQASGVEPWAILDSLESKRDYWYPNYYCNDRFIKLLGINTAKTRLSPTTARGHIRAYKHGRGHWSRRWHDRRKQKAVIQDYLRRYN
jgi:hypothetical protein